VDLDPDFQKLIDRAVDEAARKYIQSPWFDWRIIFQGVLAGLVVALFLQLFSGSYLRTEMASSQSPAPPPAAVPHSGK
jgi:hypothetical protein